MKRQEKRESSIPTSFEQIDQTAYEHLQTVRRRTHNNFNLESCEFAQEAALKISKRQATGVKLAEDLIRDGRRKTMQSYSANSQLSKGITEYLRLQDEHDEPEPELSGNFELSLLIIKKALSGLNRSQLLALHLKLTGQDNEERITALLKVSTRQYRYYITSLKQQLQSHPGFREAFMLIWLHAQEVEIIQYLNTLIKKQLAIQKAA